jgi:hypothetical protein
MEDSYFKGISTNLHGWTQKTSRNDDTASLL